MSEGEGSASRVAIGLSFGNSYSSIAYTTSDGKAEVIANEEGDRQIPSILSYVEGEQFQGTQAKSQLVRNAKNTVAYFRDLIGKDFKSIDPTPCHPSAHPHEHQSTINFMIKDTESDEENAVTIAEITTRHIRRLKESATDFLGKEVTSAVITVPSNFTKEQREALTKASEAAGLEVLQLISEPTAALLAYDARNGAPTADKNVLIADIGGIRTDVSVVACRGGIYTTLATIHDYDIGGARLDEVLMEFFAAEFKKKFKDAEDPMKNERALAKLKLESESVKKALSLSTNAQFGIESLSSGNDFTCSINRTRYEIKASKTFSAISRLIAQAISKANMDPLDIDECILSGGSSHTPRIASNIENAFPEKTIVWAPSLKSDAINPSELAARGAAIQASLIADFETEDIKESCHPVVTATPHLKNAVGILCITGDEVKGAFKPILEANTPVPVRRTATITAPKDGGDVLIKICEGSKHIKITKTEKPAANGDKNEEDEDFDEEEEDEETRETVWKADKVIAECAIKGIKKGGKVEVQISVGPDLAVNITAREVGGKGGVRGAVNAA